MAEPTSPGPSASEKLAQIAKQLSKQESAEPVAVRELLQVVRCAAPWLAHRAADTQGAGEG